MLGICTYIYHISETKQFNKNNKIRYVYLCILFIDLSNGFFVYKDVLKSAFTTHRIKTYAQKIQSQKIYLGKFELF